MPSQDRHEFALYVPEISTQKNADPGALIMLHDQALITRIQSILRLEQGETCILFCRNFHLQVALESISKKNISCRIMRYTPNKELKPSITFALPILKKDDLESSLYSCVELGANKIQLITTQKIHRAWAGEKELDRATRIMISAAEQSKNFALPELLAPITLTTFLEQTKNSPSTNIYYDVGGKPILTILNDLNQKKPHNLILMVGPEADLTPDEKEAVIAHNFIICSLTPTILRATQAVAVGLGIIRSSL